MTDPSRDAAARLTADLQAVFGSRLQSVVAYGACVDGRVDAPLTCLALVTSLGMADLEALAQRRKAWRHARIATPLVLPVQEFERSLDAFPLEYGEIIRAHLRVFGDDPFVGLRIARDDLRRACETQVKSHLLHLRESFIETGGTPEAIAEVVSQSAAAFGALLRNVARLSGAAEHERLEATLAGARMAGIPEQVVSDVLALEGPNTVGAADPARIFPAYLAAVEQLARTVDAWRTN